MKLNANGSEQFSFTTLYDELPQSFCHEKLNELIFLFIIIKLAIDEESFNFHKTFLCNKFIHF